MINRVSVQFVRILTKFRRIIPLQVYFSFYSLKLILRRKNFIFVPSKIGKGLRILSLGEPRNWYASPYRIQLYTEGLLRRGRQIGNVYGLDLIDFKDSDLVVDCGANMGDLQLYFLFKDRFVEYVGFEPNPTDYEFLEKNTLMPISKVMNFGLWKSSHLMKFYVDSTTASSSFIKPPIYSEEIFVQAYRLDDFQFHKEIKLLKIEGEGAEPEILNGALKTLENVQYVAVDVGPERGVLQEPTRDTCFSFLTKRGFKLVREFNSYRKSLLMVRSQ